MKHEVATLEGAPLDAAVAKAEGWTLHGVEVMHLAASTSWAIAGPIIERERIEIQPSPLSDWWFACVRYAAGQRVFRGPTPLIAAMRAYVAARFGDEVETVSA
jgi:hypothetical protein